MEHIDIENLSLHGERDQQATTSVQETNLLNLPPSVRRQILNAVLRGEVERQRSNPHWLPQLAWIPLALVRPCGGVPLCFGCLFC